MRTICLYFQVHQPFRFRRYRFFDIGNDHYYYDDFSNESILRKVSDKCYLPANKILLDLLQKHKGKFKVAFSISGMALEQFRLYAPEVTESFRTLAETGQVEFLSETYAHSLASLISDEEFKKQVEDHRSLINKTFGANPSVFRNTELVYSDRIGKLVYDMGFEAMLTEGAKHVLGWKSPNYLYCNALEPRLKVLLKNFKLSDDIAFRFSNTSWADYPLDADKFVKWLNQLPAEEETVNLFMDYETFGEHQWADTGIFEFLQHFPGTVFAKSNFKFATPSEVARSLQVVSAIQVPNPISWADEERDLSAWLGNEMQKEAFHKLYDLREQVYKSQNREIILDFGNLQTSDHFYYMSTKFFSDGEVHSYFNPYHTPYEAFINYMNVLSDYKIRIDAAVPSPENEEISRLSRIISEKEEAIKKYEKRLQQIESAKKNVTVKSSKKSTTPKASDTHRSTSGKTKIIKDKGATSSESRSAKSAKKPVGKTVKGKTTKGGKLSSTK